MLGKIRAGLAVLRAGRAVANPAAWKRGQVTVNQVATLLGVLAVAVKGLGLDFPVPNDEVLLAVAGGLYAVLNWVFTVASTDKVGILGTGPSAAGGGGGGGVVIAVDVARGQDRSVIYTGGGAAAPAPRSTVVAGAPGHAAAGGAAAPPAPVGSIAAQPVAPDPVRLQPGAAGNTDPYLPG